MELNQPMIGTKRHRDTEKIMKASTKAKLLIAGYTVLIVLICIPIALLGLSRSMTGRCRK